MLRAQSHKIAPHPISDVNYLLEQLTELRETLTYQVIILCVCMLLFLFFIGV